MVRSGSFYLALVLVAAGCQTAGHCRRCPPAAGNYHAIHTQSEGKPLPKKGSAPAIHDERDFTPQSPADSYSPPPVPGIGPSGDPTDLPQG